MRRLACFLILAAGPFLLLSCEESSDSPPAEALTLSPSAVVTQYGGLTLFSPAGGQAPYVFSLSYNESGGSVHPDTGWYQAGYQSPGLDKVLVRDARGETAEASVQVLAPLSLTPTTATLLKGDVLHFQAAGGTPPYLFSLSINGSGGTVDSSTGLYTAGQTVDVTDVIEVEDTTGSKVTASVQVFLTYPLMASPSSTLVLAGNSRTVALSGGTPPYLTSFSQNQSAGTAYVSAATLHYTAGSDTNGATGSIDILDVTDSAVPPQTTQVSVVVPGLQLSPSNASTQTNSSLQFTGSGGLPPYTWTLTASASGGTLSSNGAYTSGIYSGVDVITLSDANGTQVTGHVNVTAVVVSGQTLFNASHGDALDFSQSPVLLSYGLLYNTLGDVFFEEVTSYIGPPPTPNLPIQVTKGNGLVFDAGTNTAVDPRSVSYSSTLITVPIGHFNGTVQTPIVNKTVCVKTQEGWFARLVFPNGHLGPCVYTVYK